MGLAETKEAIDAAAKAFPAWSRTTAKVRHLLCSQLHPLKSSVQHRHDILMKLYALMKEHHDDLGRIIVRSGRICATNPLTCVQDPRERKTASGSEGVLNPFTSSFITSYPFDTERKHIQRFVYRGDIYPSLTHSALRLTYEISGLVCTHRNHWSSWFFESSI
jgi:hypothetical protein